jgi:two-component system NarL family sensor kinase
MQDLHSATYLLANVEDLDPATQKNIKGANDVIQEAIVELRTLAQELRPPAVIDFGLQHAILSHVEDLKEKYPGIEFRLSLEEEDLSEEIRLTFFRIYQTSIANVIRHAAATIVSVRLALDAEEISLEIKDNGKGFQVPPRWIMLMRTGHFGLAGAAERVSALGGIFKVESAPSKGTRVLIRLAFPSES